jgi:hypothetical protein
MKNFSIEARKSPAKQVHTLYSYSLLPVLRTHAKVAKRHKRLI